MSLSEPSAMSSSRPLYQQQDPELRRLKEAFVSNLSGTTRWEVFCVLSSLPLCLLIAAYLESRLSARLRSSSILGKQQQQRTLPKFPFEFCGAVLPLLLLLMSVAPAEPAFLLLFLCWGSLALKLWMRLAHGPAARQHMGHMLQHMAAPRKRFVSAFRGGVMLATCLAILGVDFPAFPRRYAKAEGYGGGVMDVGVGAIIFAGGLVSAVAAGAATAAADATAAAAGGSSGSGAAAAAAAAHGSSSAVRVRLLQLLRGVKAAVPLLLLGCAREVATAVVGYQAHLGEYGLHWNFFYTIAGVTLLTLAVPVPSHLLGPLGLAVTGCHQLLLSWNLRKLLLPTAAAAAGGSIGSGVLQVLAQLPGLLEGGGSCSNSTIVTSSRVEGSDACLAPPEAAAGVASLGAWVHLDLGVEARQAAGFWASNKEGLGSLPGYWALHLLGAAVGHQLGVSCAVTAARARAQLSSSSGSRPGGNAAAVGEAARLVWAWVGVWWVVDLVLWGVLAVVEGVVEPVSRRACNLPYVLWTAAQCLAWLLLVLMADLLTSVLCSTSGGCGISPGSSSLHAPAPAAAPAAGGPRGPVRRSLDAGTGSHPAQPESAHAGAAAAAAVGQLPRSPKSGVLHRRSLGKKGSSGSGSSPMAAAAAAAAALTAAAAVGSGGIAAGGSTAAMAAAAAAVVGDSPRNSSGSSRGSSPRKPTHSKGAAAAAAAAGCSPQGGVSPKGGGSDKGSPKAGSWDHNSSGSSSPLSLGGGGSTSNTPARQRRQGGSRMQPQQQPQQQQSLQQQRQEPSSSSSISGGPMRLMLAINRNMLALFLISNLLTGAVNLSVNTLAVGSWTARAIVGMYMLLLCGLAVFLDKRGLTLKLPW